MEIEDSLPHSQVPAICPYTEPAQSSPYPTSHFLKIHIIIIIIIIIIIMRNIRSCNHHHEALELNWISLYVCVCVSEL